MSDFVQCAVTVLGAAFVICGTAEIRDRIFAAKYDDPDLRMALSWWAAYYSAMNGRVDGSVHENRSMLSRYLMAEHMSRYRRMLDDEPVIDALRSHKLLRRNGTIMERNYQKAGRVLFEAGRHLYPAAKPS